jgi:hypothetical protein
MHLTFPLIVQCKSRHDGVCSEQELLKQSWKFLQRDLGHVHQSVAPGVQVPHEQIC